VQTTSTTYILFNISTLQHKNLHFATTIPYHITERVTLFTSFHSTVVTTPQPQNKMK